MSEDKPDEGLSIDQLKAYIQLYASKNDQFLSEMKVISKEIDEMKFVRDKINYALVAKDFMGQHWEDLKFFIGQQIATAVIYLCVFGTTWLLAWMTKTQSPETAALFNSASYWETLIFLCYFGGRLALYLLSSFIIELVKQFQNIRRAGTSEENS